MKHKKFDVVLQFGQLDMNDFASKKYLNNEHYGVEIIKHNVSAEEAKQYVIFHGMNHVFEKENENYHVKNFYATCFWTIAQKGK